MALKSLTAIALSMMLLLALTPQAFASEDPAAQQIEKFDNALLDAMKGGKKLGMQGRYDKLAPTIDQTFNLEFMTALVVGPYWKNIATDKRSKVVDAFRQWTVAIYAKNFDEFSGQQFTVNPEVTTRNADKIVRTQLVQKGSDPVDLSYRMRQTGTTWKVIDVYYNGTISQLATQRSDFGATLTSGGPDAFVKKLDELTRKLMQGG